PPHGADHGGLWHELPAALAGHHVGIWLLVRGGADGALRYAVAVLLLLEGVDRGEATAGAALVVPPVPHERASPRRLPKWLRPLHTHPRSDRLSRTGKAVPDRNDECSSDACSCPATTCV